MSNKYLLTSATFNPRIFFGISLIGLSGQFVSIRFTISNSVFIPFSNLENRIRGPLGKNLSRGSVNSTGGIA